MFIIVFSCFFLCFFLDFSSFLLLLDKFCSFTFSCFSFIVLVSLGGLGFMGLGIFTLCVIFSSSLTLSKFLTSCLKADISIFGNQFAQFFAVSDLCRAANVGQLSQLVTSILSRPGYGHNKVICKKGPESSEKLWKVSFFEKNGLKKLG